MKKCIYCGAELEDSVRFCPYCGKPAEKEEENAGQAEERQNFENNYNYSFRGIMGGLPLPRPRYNGMAIASLVLGIVGIFFNAFYMAPSILAIVFGILGRNQIKKDPAQKGMGMAVAGLILGIVFLALYVLLIILSLAAWQHIAGTLDWGELIDTLEHLM